MALLQRIVEGDPPTHRIPPDVPQSLTSFLSLCFNKSATRPSADQLCAGLGWGLDDVGWSTRFCRSLTTPAVKKL